uniref:LRAT domain-containing protein n=1 Tax=Sinocyclocheilus rhinocerous TaxID=307959 RepID=A0A673FW69_9TELE
MSFKTALGLLLLAVLAIVSESSSGKSTFINFSDLKKLYNSKVYMAERFARPLDGMPFQIGILSHSGVSDSTDGSKWLIHKGDDYGKSSQTVVVDGHHMSNNWKLKEQKDFGGSKTVSDFVKAGGAEYKLLFDNCHNAANWMMND